MTHAIEGARPTVTGLVITSDDVDFDQARALWNGMIDTRPAVIVRAADASDVAPTIAFARTTGLPLAIRGGGHNVAGHGSVEGGVVLDLGGLTRIEVDPARRLVRVEAGATLADVDRATEPHGLAVPIGMVSGTGIAGLTLGGGAGWLTRAHGLTLDNLVAADVVLATGASVRASADEHPDLFWALRGGGGNFGVVTSFTFRAHPLDPNVLAGSLVYERARWGDALRAWVAWAADAPDEIATIITFMVPPPAWELGDRALMFLGFAWAGADRLVGESEVARLRGACEPDIAMTGPTTWRTFQSAFDGALPKGVRAYWRNAWFETLGEPAIDALVEWCGRQTRAGIAADLHQMGGAFARAPEDATAFPDRRAQFWLNIYGFWPDAADDAANVAWVKGFSDAVRPQAMPLQYVNFLGQDTGDPLTRALAVYGPEKLARLRAVKGAYDPENIFRVNHNIAPAGI